MTIPTVRYRKIDCGIGKQVPLSIVVEIFKKRATHVSFHSNNIHSLELSSPQRHQCKNKEEETIRSGAPCLELLLELDLSSNCLHEGYALPRLHASKKVSLLGLCSKNLLTLNLASNGLNEQSFSNMMTDESSETSFVLPRLHTLDISHNNFTVLPRQLRSLCPSLKHLAAVNNEVKSLTTLLQDLHSLRGKLESLLLMDDTSSSMTNLACSKDLYREKIIFLAGTQLLRLDGVNISDKAREDARLKLEHGYGLDIHPTLLVTDKTKVSIHALSTSREKKQNHAKQEFNDHEEVIEDEEMHEKIKTLEAQVASLSATIERYATSAKLCDSDESIRSKVEKQESQNSFIRRREIIAACYLCSIVSRRRNKAPLYIAFSLWLTSTRFDKHAKISKVQQIESEKKWAQQTKEIVDQAIQNETEFCKRKLDHSRIVIQESEDRISNLTREVEDLEKHLQNEKRNQRQCEVVFGEASDVMKADIQRLEAKLRKQKSGNEEDARWSATELNRLRAELQLLSETLAEERRNRTKVESENTELKIAYEDVKSRVAKDAELLKQLKMEVVSKEDTIQSVKVAYEHAAKRSAVDRSRCDQAVAAEKKAKDLLHKQTITLQTMEAETCRYVADHQSTYSAKISGLSRDVEEREERLKASTMRIKSILQEQDELRTQLINCKKIMSQTEEQNVYLETQLNRAAETMLKAKKSSIDKEKFFEAQSRIKDLKQSLDLLRISSQQREQTLLNKSKEDTEEHERMVKSLSRKLQLAKREWVARVEQIESMHRLEIQQLTDAKQRELASMDIKFESERKIRLELEEKVAKLQSEIAIQKLKTKSAIDSMVNKLSET